MLNFFIISYFKVKTGKDQARKYKIKKLKSGLGIYGNSKKYFKASPFEFRDSYNSVR